MLIPPETLIDGAMRTLREAVLPDVGSRFARGQLYAVLDVLNNLRDCIEEKSAFFTAEVSSAEPVLELIVAKLGEAGREADATAVRKAYAETGDAPLVERVVALRAALVRAIDAIRLLPEPARAEAEAALQGHLVAQVVRDVAPLKQSLLTEISKG